MKKIFITFLLIGATNLITAQTYSVPALSPKQSIEQQFSISNLKIDYGRPAVKGRKIFGELVPYGQVWRAGANAATKLTVEQAIIFGDKVVAPGEYALFIIPETKQWTIILNKEANAWGSYKYNEALNVATTNVPVHNLNTTQEYLEFRFDPKSENSTNLIISWDKVKVEIPIQVNNSEVINKITNKLQEIKQIQRDANKK